MIPMAVGLGCVAQALGIELTELMPNGVVELEGVAEK
jgi:hypothetical protein